MRTVTNGFDASVANWHYISPAKQLPSGVPLYCYFYCYFRQRPSNGNSKFAWNKTVSDAFVLSNSRVLRP